MYAQRTQIKLKIINVRFTIKVNSSTISSEKNFKN